MLFSGGVRGGGVFLCVRGRPGAAPGDQMADFLQSNTPGNKMVPIQDPQSPAFGDVKALALIKIRAMRWRNRSRDPTYELSEHSMSSLDWG